MTDPDPKYSTTVRFIRLATRAAGALAPGWVTEQAFLRFGRPHRHPNRWEQAPAGSSRLDAAGHEVALWEWNAGGRDPVLLVHGWSGNAGQLRAFVGPLVERGHHVLAVDLPAHGASPGTFAAIPVFADVVGALLGRLRPRAVIAHSLGATGTALALGRGVQPARVALLAPPLSAVGFVMQFAAAAGLSPELTRRFKAHVEGYVGGFEAVDLRHHAPALGAVEALVVHDVGDAVVPVRSAHTLVAHWPGARLLETRGLSHDLVRRDPQVVQAVVDFVGAPKSTTVRLPEVAL